MRVHEHPPLHLRVEDTGVVDKPILCCSLVRVNHDIVVHGHTVVEDVLLVPAQESLLELLAADIDFIQYSFELSQVRHFIGLCTMIDAPYFNIRFLRFLCSFSNLFSSFSNLSMTACISFMTSSSFSSSLNSNSGSFSIL